MEQSGRRALGFGRPQGPVGLGTAIVRARRRPISRNCCAAARTSCRSVLPGGNLGGRGFALHRARAVVLWGFSGFFRVEPDELGVVLRFGKYVRDVAAGPELSPAVSDRDRADAEGAARQQDRYRHAPRSTTRAAAPRCATCRKKA